MPEEIHEMPAPQPDGIYSRSELVGVIKALMQMNRSLSQAIALALVEHWSPSFARSLSRQLDRTLHPQFTEIVQAVQQPTNKKLLSHGKEGEAV